MNLTVKAEEIASVLVSHNRSNPLASLYLGKSGEALFRFVLNKISKISQNQAIEECIHFIISDIENNYVNNYTICGGISGAVWFLKYLNKNGYVNLDEDMFDELFPLMHDAADTFLREHNCDFLHGAGGIILVLLAEPQKNRLILEDLTEGLLNERINFGKYRLWQYISDSNGDKIEISLGLSHGIPSMMVLLSKLYKNDILPNQCLEAILECFTFLNDCRNEDLSEENYSFYPSYVVKDAVLQHNSRMSWCYGDLGIGIALYVTGTNIGRDDMIREALAIYDHYAAATLSNAKTGVIDTCFCHGASGLGHLFNRMYINTGNVAYRKTAAYWIDIVLKISNKSGGFENFQIFLGGKGWEYDSSLLNGLCGVGLVLSSFALNENPDWDECFLLS